LPNWLGDGLMARPMLHALAAAGGGERVRAAGPPALLELLAPEGLFASAEAWPAAPAERSALMGRVREWRPDGALILPPSFASAWSARESGAPARVGFASDRRSFLLTVAARRVARGERHLSLEYLDLLQRMRHHLGEAAPDAAAPGAMPPLPLLPVPAVARTGAELLMRSQAGAPTRYALLAPGARYGPAKRWESGRYADLGRRLAARGLTIAVCGTDEDQEVCESVAEAIGAPAVSLAGRTAPGPLAGLCAGAALAVSNDSGFAHLSAAVGAPTIVLFGSTSSAWTAPLGPRVRVIQHAPVCSPCFQRHCRIGTRCLTAITVDEVEAACRAIAA
jgi:heptosyltransferase-2